MSAADTRSDRDSSFRRGGALAFVLCLAWAGSAQAQSACERPGSAYQMSWNIALGNISVPRGAPIGTVIHEQELGSVQNNKTILRCTGGGNGQSSELMLSQRVPSMPGYYQTNISGVALRVDYPTQLGDRQFTSPATPWSVAGDLIWPGPLRLRLVKTGPIVPDAFAKGKLFEWTAPDTTGGRMTIAVGNLASGSVAVSGATCDIPSSVPVVLGDHPVTTFTGPGAASPWVDFNLPLRNCPSDYSAILYHVTALNGVLPTSQGVVLDVRKGGAEGVAVQVWDVYHDMSLRIDAGQQFMGLAPGQENVDFPMRARILQYGASVTPGSVDSAMEVRMEYR